MDARHKLTGAVRRGHRFVLLRSVQLIIVVNQTNITHTFGSETNSQRAIISCIIHQALFIYRSLRSFKPYLTCDTFRRHHQFGVEYVATYKTPNAKSPVPSRGGCLVPVFRNPKTAKTDAGIDCKNKILAPPKCANR